MLHGRGGFRSIPNGGLGPSVVFFARHPLLDIGRTVQDRYAPRLASVEKPNTLDVDKIHFLDVQDYQCSAAVDLSLNLVQIQAEIDCRSEEHTSELQSHLNLVCRLLLEKKKNSSTSAQHAIRAYNDTEGR